MGPKNTTPANPPFVVVDTVVELIEAKVKMIIPRNIKPIPA
ncbi:hypothetical protein YN1HA_13790 [Sulfurisphaera ohwakuensis]